MARPLFEQYKDALRRGHLALLGDELDAALAAYRDAAALVPDRPLPYASIGAVLDRLGRTEEALAAYDRAIALAPGDPTYALPREAIALALDAAGPAPAAPDLAVLAAESVAPVVAEPEPELVVAVPEVESAPDVEPVAAAPEPVVEPGAEPAAIVEPAIAAGAATVAAPTPGTSWPAIDLPSPPPPPLVGPPPDPAKLQAEADALVDGGDPAAARDLLLLAVAVHREAGRLDAAIDSCLQLLALTPGDPRVHLAIANLQLDRGWRSVATEKIELLLRLTSLSGDTQAEADVHLLAADRLRDESPARLDARKRGIATP
jgi:tetratricopeptide (TPR) repeat protein